MRSHLLHFLGEGDWRFPRMFGMWQRDRMYWRISMAAAARPYLAAAPSIRGRRPSRPRLRCCRTCTRRRGLPRRPGSLPHRRRAAPARRPSGTSAASRAGAGRRSRASRRGGRPPAPLPVSAATRATCSRSSRASAAALNQLGVARLAGDLRGDPRRQVGEEWRGRGRVEGKARRQLDQQDGELAAEPARLVEEAGGEVRAAGQPALVGDRLGNFFSP